MTTLSPEAVAQAPEWPAHVDCKVECWFSPTLRAIAAENAALRAENEELDFLRHEGGPDSVAAMEIELAALRASEAAAMERIAELEAAACSYQAALMNQGIDGSKGPKE